ncbi:MAG TPA: hypothetical protein VMG34_06500 [Bacteroidota bacterium]|nr:hypothetical protein [Bacteroidota bacterium]
MNFKALLQLFSRVAALAIMTFALTVVDPGSAARAQYTGKENHVVPLDSAVHFIQNFRAKPATPSLKGGYFGRSIFEKILSQPGAVGIRYYYAAKDDGSPTLVLVGVDSTGDDMVKGVVGEVITPCPPLCSSANELNK